MDLCCTKNEQKCNPKPWGFLDQFLPYQFLWLQDILLQRELLIINNEKQNMAMGKHKDVSAHTHSWTEVRVQVQRGKVVVCTNTMPLLTQDCHCTQKHTSHFPHRQLNNTTAAACCSLSVLMLVCGVYAKNPIAYCTIRYKSAAHSLAVSQLISLCRLTDMLRLTHRNINGEGTVI